MSHHAHDAGEMRQMPYIVGISLNLIFVLSELVLSQLAHSTALFADAFHNLSDVLALVIAWLAVLVFGLRATRQHTYGWHNVSILASIFNALLLLFAVALIFYEGIRDLFLANPEHTKGWLVTIVAAVGIVVNFSTAMLFKASGTPDEHGHTHGQDLNAKTAYLHLLSDAAVSIGVIIAGWLIQITGWQIIDPIVSMIIGVVILISSWDVMKSTFNLALNGVPDTVDEKAVLEYLEGLAGVSKVHDLHIWPLSTTEAALTVHLAIKDMHQQQALLDKITKDLREHYHIAHVTIQIESEQTDEECNRI
ncbi:cation diffusion facilitator family transporter [Eupransor demetentiae]|uniref:Co/Zn/Cd efflux system component (CzcD) n=1 Tax=Eupransor demetentiae TaxID=3109584 RepID=A0ABM9N5P0_9LACO|nr:Co/Zn/Cd efflux system component (CzcD) [Lactobacillaceae bacterium LMG 33000]